MPALQRPTEIDVDESVDDVMRRWPQTLRVFLEFRMKCVGCPIATFHSIRDSCREHRVDLDRFVAALQSAIS
jgi:hybrid cluster-associated redox disulfide protein